MRSPVLIPGCIGCALLALGLPGCIGCALLALGLPGCIGCALLALGLGPAIGSATRLALHQHIQAAALLEAHQFGSPPDRTTAAQ